MSFWEDKKVLVTGGAGFVGSHLVEMLVRAGARVTAADDFSRGTMANLQAVLDDIDLETADVTQPEHCLRITKDQEIVINMAAKVGGVEYNLNHPASMFRGNIRSSTYLLEAAQAASVERYVVVSSACVYQRHCTIPTPETEGFDGWPEPTNEGYGWAKRMEEFEATAVNKEFGLPVAIVRPYNAYGPRDHFDPKTSHVIAALIRRIVGGENPVKVWGDGEQTRAFLYVEDFARGVMAAAENYTECDPVNLGADEEVKIKDLVSLILEVAGSSAKVEFDTTKPSGQPRRNCDTRKAKEKLGFEAQVSLREGLRQTIEWYVKNNETKPNPSHV
jgi:GDP-L-fucose synthase